MGFSISLEAGMDQETLVDRVEVLEHKVERLEELPARVDALTDRMGAVEGRLGALESQILQFRQEVRTEFLTVRGEMREMEGRLRADLRADMIKVDEETRTHMRVLFEEAISRIATMGEANAGKKKRKPTKH